MLIQYCFLVNLVFQQHIQRHLSNPYKCEACEEKFRTENELNTHVSIHPAYWKCSECEITCTDKHHFDKHKKAHERSVTCEECGKKWKRMADLKRHIACVHSDGNQNYREWPRSCTDYWNPEQYHILNTSGSNGFYKQSHTSLKVAYVELIAFSAACPSEQMAIDVRT